MRLAFWVMLGIPISFLGTFIFMSGADVSLNMITMFAFLISLGIVVDDAIVVGENIYHYHQKGMPFLQAAIKGARQIALPVTFSIITNIVAFHADVFCAGCYGQIFSSHSVVVCSTFLISLIESLFILPAHLGHQSDQKRGGKLHAFQNHLVPASPILLKKCMAHFSTESYVLVT